MGVVEGRHAQGWGGQGLHRVLSLEHACIFEGLKKNNFFFSVKIIAQASPAS